MLLDIQDGGRRVLFARCVIVTTVVLVWCLMTFLYEITDFGYQAWTKVVSKYSASHSQAPSAAFEDRIPDNLKELAAPYLANVNASSFLTADRTAWDVPKPRWNENLGSRLCIVDVDTRPLQEVYQIWSGKDFNWEKMDEPSPGRLNHYTYSLIHGYQYHYIRPKDIKERFAPWQKLPVLAELLRHYDVVVYADADVVFSNLHLPIELLLNRWEMPRDVSVIMPLDVDWDSCKDSRGRIMQNAGLIILVKNPTTFEMLDRWWTCPEEIKGCDKFLLDWPAEQGVFGEFIRYLFPHSVGEIPCDEGMGWPEADHCHGSIVRHYTMGKSMVKAATAESLNVLISKALQADMVLNKEALFVDKTLEDLQEPVESEASEVSEANETEESKKSSEKEASAEEDPWGEKQSNEDGEPTEEKEKGEEDESEDKETDEKDESSEQDKLNEKEESGET